MGKLLAIAATMALARLEAGIAGDNAKQSSIKGPATQPVKSDHYSTA